VTTISRNVSTLATALRAAAGPRVPLIGLTYPDVILGTYVYPTQPPTASRISLAKLSVVAFRSLINPALTKAYGSVGGVLVDVTAATGAYTSLARTVRLRPYGTIPVPVASVCTLTWFCSQGNIHATTKGYTLIGRLAVAQFVANTMGSLSLRHPLASARLLVTNRQWMLGYGAGWIGWGLYIAALSLAPLSLVQAVSAGGVGILAILAHRLGTPLTRQERIGTWIAVGGLALLGLSLTSDVTPTSPARSMTLIFVIAVGALLAAILVLLARGFRPGALLGCAAGLLFGVGDLATKGAVDGVGLLFVPILAVCTALGFVTLQLAFQRGRVLETAGSSTLVNNLIPIVGGVVVFHETIPSGLPGVARVASFVAVVAGAVLLASGRMHPQTGATPTPLSTHS